jgi:hypothetical protein
MDAELLFSHGVRADSSSNIIKDFTTISKLRPTLGKAVWHAPISFAYDDKLDNDLSIQIGQDYLTHLGLAANQYIIAKHNDTKHVHLHIVANRVGFDGSVVSDKFCKNRSARASDLLEVKYGLVIAREVRRNRKRITNSLDTTKLKGKAKIKRELKELIRSEVDHCISNGTKTLEGLKAKLNLKNIETRFQFNPYNELIGVSFRANGVAIKGSLVHGDLRAKKLKERLDANTLKRSKGLRL